MPTTSPGEPIRRDLSENPHVRLAGCPEEFYSALRLVYNEYLRHGLTSYNQYGMRATRHHLLPTTDLIVATRPESGNVICTLSLVGDSPLGLPIELAFPDLVALRRTEGISIAEVTSLASDAVDGEQSAQVVLQVMAFMAQRARYRGIAELLITVHPHHSSFYRKIVGFEMIGCKRSYDTVNGKPAVSLSLDLVNLHRNHPASYQRFFGQKIPEQLLAGTAIVGSLQEELVPIVLACESSGRKESGSSNRRTA